ncbi:acyl carrier protein [Thalassolituus hydrocarboniclasticus]|uniref:Acyl carrier protein n=1 Tax=Thalassolituus hydrocarboniclasticus TaxID=2742796 RepID=A0ABY6AAA4_9GAMM|nr:acyl carrier protein [Thalassolituus hydrocarboniclasticus]UXD87951.1 acyl carrier protein [Thalassolituus hydrocarboniclasticus]
MSLTEKVCAIVAGVLKTEANTLDSHSGLGVTPKWDSLNHTKLVLELEEVFDIEFDFSELDKIITVEAIVSSLEGKGVCS